MERLTHMRGRFIVNSNRLVQEIEMIRGLCTVLVVVSLLPGCAMFGGGAPPPPPDLSKISISTRAGEPDLDLHAKTTARRVLVGTGVGMGTGFVTAAAGTFAFFSVASIPLWVFPPAGGLVMVMGIVAAPFVGAAGAVVGGVAGAGTGAYVGGLPWGKAGDVNAIVKDPQLLRDFSRELGVAVRANVPESRQAERSSALTLVALEITRVELTQDRSDSLGILMRASAKYSWGQPGRRSDEASATCTYEFETEKAYVDDWLAGGAEVFDAALIDGINGVARLVAQDMASDVPLPEDKGSSLFGIQMKKMGANTYDVSFDTAEDNQARQSEECLKKLRGED